MEALLLALLSLVALGCGSADTAAPVPDGDAEAVAGDAGSEAGDAPTGQQEAAVEASSVDASSTCAAPMTTCGGACVDVRSNPVHCGGCRRSCRADEVCHEGACSTADAGRADVSPVSAAATADVEAAVARAPGDRPCTTVSDCGTILSGREPSCQEGQCVDVCPANFADCDGNPVNGCETRLDQRESCGACTRWCGPGGACARYAGGYRCA